MAVDAAEGARDGGRGWLRRHPWLSGAAGAVAVGGIAFVLIWFQPQALLFDTVVDEEFPVAEAVDDADTDPTDAESAADDEPSDDGDEPTAEEDGDVEERETVEDAGPVALMAGEFASRNRYTVTGTATVYALEDGSRTLRLEDFESTNGPDLYVYLTAADHADTDDDLDADVVDLGRLRGNIGNQNYEIPDEVASTATTPWSSGACGSPPASALPTSRPPERRSQVGPRSSAGNSIRASWRPTPTTGAGAT